MDSYIDKHELNRWISDLDNKEQLDALRSVIASAQDPEGIWQELSKAAQQNIGQDPEGSETDSHMTSKRFWELVWSLRESSKPWSWDDLSEAEKAGIDRGLADLEAGRTIPNEEVWKKIEEKFGYKSGFRDKK